MSDFIVTDWLDREIKVGSRCRADEDHIVSVISITEPDADYDDELGRAVQYSPRITFKYEDGTTETLTTYDNTTITWACYPDGPSHQTFVCDDLEVE